MARITLTDKQFDTFTSVVSYVVFNRCQSLDDIHIENFRLEHDAAIDDWEVCFVIEVNRKTAVNICVDRISATFRGKAIELTDAQMDELNKVVRYTIEGSL